MPKKSTVVTPLTAAQALQARQDKITRLQQQLTSLASGLASILPVSELRTQVQALIPVKSKLKELGIALVPEDNGDVEAGRARILYYFKQYQRLIIKREELAIVAGIDDYPRRIRELRQDFGWNVVSGKNAKQAAAEADDQLLDGIDVSSMRVDDYILLSDIQDTEGALKWRIANDIRKIKDVAGKEKIRRYMTHENNVGKFMTSEVLQYVTKGASDWARRVRELRSEDAWPIVTVKGGYILQENKQGAPHDRGIKQGVYSAVLDRDSHQCRKCGWNYGMAHSGDLRKRLELHHIEHHKNGGSNEIDNLITLCNVHHDEVHSHKPPLTPTQLFDWLVS